MSALKALRDRRKTIQSTQKITLAMKMVAAAKLRRAQAHAEAGRPYATHMQKILSNLARNAQALESPHPLLTGTGKRETHLILLATSNRGLCGPFNASLARYTKKVITDYQEQGLQVKLFCMGIRGQELLEREFGSLMVERLSSFGTPRFSDAEQISAMLITMMQKGVFDVCTIIYNHFQSAMTQTVTMHQLIPLTLEEATDPLPSLHALYEYEPHENTLLNKLLPQNLAVQLYSALLENAASEQGARMTAMDSANRNASDMLEKLTLTYNRTRQTHITRELIEIIAGAETLRA